MLLVNFDPGDNRTQLAAFRARYGVGTNAAILGPYQGRLDNSAASLRLFKPGEPELSASTNGVKVPKIIVDAVEYSDEWPWPVAADGIGHSLQRNNSADYGNDPANWSASAPTAGAANAHPTPPAITRQPTGQIVVAGVNVTLSVTPTGAGPFAYAWRFQGQKLHSATNVTLALNAVTARDAGDYQAVVLSGSGSVASAPAKLTVLEPPKIVLQPLSQNLAPGTNTTLAVSVKANGPVSYQWRFEGANIAGASTASLVLTNMQPAKSGAYSVVVSDKIGATFSQPAIVNVLVKPEIISQSLGQSVFIGDSVAISVSATGTIPLSYRWRRDGVNIPNATNAVFNLNSVQLEDAGNYSVVITNIASGRINIVSQEAPLLVFADFDKDRMADIWEIANGFATNNAADALLDTDGDGITNQREYVAGTDPRNKQDFFKIDAVKMSAGSTEIQFLARTNKTYTVQFKDTLSSTSWFSLTNVFGQTSNRVETVVDRSPRPGSRFYRLLTPALP